MAKKIMIVVWKWSVGWRFPKCEKFVRDTDTEKICCDFIGEDCLFEVTVNGEECQFFGFTKNNKYPNKSENGLKEVSYGEGEIIAKCEEMIEENSNNKILLLLHGGETDNFKEKHLNEEKWEKLKKNSRVIIDFFSSEGAIYDHLINGNQTYFLIRAINSPNNGTSFSIKKDNFNKVWNHYYLCIEQKKNELIKKWIPLAIDIQGLSEVEESKRKDYLSDIFKSNNKNNDYYKQLLVNFWSLIVEQKFKIENGNFEKENTDKNEESLQSIFNTTEENFRDFFSPKKESDIDIGLDENIANVNKNSPLVKFIEQMDSVCSDSKNVNDLSKDYILKSHREFFFPEWLEKFVRKLDEIEKII